MPSVAKFIRRPRTIGTAITYNLFAFLGAAIISSAILDSVRATPMQQRASWEGRASADFKNVAVGYPDGYWDNGRHWHRWRDAGEARSYRLKRGGDYFRYNHDVYGNNGWNRN